METTAILGREADAEPLTLSEIGRATEGALLVYLAPGEFLPDGRRKFDTAQADDGVLIGDMEGVWDIGRHLDEWSFNPHLSPQVLVAVHGTPLTKRLIVGAARIDTSRWEDPTLKVPDRRRWYVPLVQPVDLDQAGLRGRRVPEVRFGPFDWQLHIWVDAEGVQRHPTPKVATSDAL